MMTMHTKLYPKILTTGKGTRVANEETPTKMIENRDDVKDQFHADTRVLNWLSSYWDDSRMGFKSQPTQEEPKRLQGVTLIERAMKV